MAVGGTAAALVGEGVGSSGALEHAAVIRRVIAMKAVPMIETGPPLRNRLLRFSKCSVFENSDCCLDTRLDYIKGSACRGATYNIASCGLRLGVWLGAFVEPFVK